MVILRYVVVGLCRFDLLVNWLFFLLRNFGFISSETSLAGGSDALFFTITILCVNEREICIGWRTLHRRRKQVNFILKGAVTLILLLFLRKIKLICFLNLNHWSTITFSIGLPLIRKYLGSGSTNGTSSKVVIIIWIGCLISLITKLRLILVLAHFLPYKLLLNILLFN